MTIEQSARDFFEACESGKGWSTCKQWCHEDATFSCHAAALAETKTLADYADWMTWLLGPVPDGRYELSAFAVDASRSTVVAAATFHGTHTGEGGPIPATGKSVATDYAYVMTFDGDKLRHMTKIWNDTQALQALGWA